MATPHNYDPTRLTPLRSRFQAAFRKRWEFVVTAIHGHLQSPVTNADPASDPIAAKVAFILWLRLILKQAELLPDPGDLDSGWFRLYLQQAYEAGIRRAHSDLPVRLRMGLNQTELAAVMRVQGTQQQAMQRLLHRFGDAINGISGAALSRASTVMLDGLTRGDSHRQLISDLADVATGIGNRRSFLLAASDVTYDHAEGQLDALQTLGITRVSMDAEIVTAGDSRVCPICQAYEGATMSIDTARGLIPIHSGCRCIWVVRS